MFSYYFEKTTINNLFVFYFIQKSIIKNNLKYFILQILHSIKTTIIKLLINNS